MRGLQRIGTFVLTVWFVLISAAFIPASASSVRVHSAPMREGSQPLNGTVRVYLASLGNPNSLNLTVEGQYVLGGTNTVFPNGTRLTLSFDSSTGLMSFSDGSQKWSFRNTATLRRTTNGSDGSIRIRQARESNNPYPADFSFHSLYGSDGYSLYVVAHIYIETYLYGVLPYEMGNSANTEALKAQAVAARTYTVRMMKSRASGIYDVKDTTSDQVYRGTPGGNANCVAAVDATKGVVLMNGQKYVTTYYSSSNGGQTEIPRGGTVETYMQVKDDPFDFDNPASTVKRIRLSSDLRQSTIPAELAELLKEKVITRLQRSGYAAHKANTNLINLLDVSVHSPKYSAPSRLYTKMDFVLTVSINGSLTAQTVTCDIFAELEPVLGGLQSSQNELWSVEETQTGFEIQIRRYGHGMGMSQRGAMYMAGQGYTYDQILGFYFEGCSRVKYSFTNNVLLPSGDEHVTIEPPAQDKPEPSNGCIATVALPEGDPVLLIRDQRSEWGRAIAGAQNGSRVEVLADYGDWCLVRYGEVRGYVPSASLRIAGTPAGIDMGASTIAGFARVTAQDYVNLRSSASLSSRIIGQAPSSAVVTVLSTSGNWARVQYREVAAYASMDYLSDIQSDYPVDTNIGTTKVAVVIAEDGGKVNLRQAPTTDSLVITSLSTGTQVNLLSGEGAWRQVSFEGITGYMMARYLHEEDDNTPTDPSSQNYARVVTQSGTLNLREKASLSARVTAFIPRGARLLVTSRMNDWCKVIYQGMNGYVMSRYLVMEDEEESEPGHQSGEALAEYATVSTESGSLNLRSQPTRTAQVLGWIPRNARVEVLAYGNNWSEVIWRGQRGYVMSSYLKLEESSENDSSQDENETREGVAWVQTPGGALNVRSSPSMTSELIGILEQGVSVMVVHFSETWCEVRNDSLHGFVMTKYLSFEEWGNPVDAWVYTDAGPLNLRGAASPGAEIITTVPRFERVDKIKEHGAWSYVRYQGMEGYVLSRYLVDERPSDGMFGKDNQTAAIIQNGIDITMGRPEHAAYAVASCSEGIILHEQCLDSSQVIAVVPSEQVVEIVLSGEQWCCVHYDGIQGYCLKTDLRVI